MIPPASNGFGSLLMDAWIGGGDVPTDIAALAVKSARDGEENAVVSRQTARRVHDAAEEQALTQLRQKADDMGDRGLLTGALQVAGGAALATGGVVQARALALRVPAPDGEIRITEGASRAVDGLARGLEQMGRAEEAVADARLRQSSRAADQAKVAVDSASEEVRRGHDGVQRSLDRAEAVVRAVADAQRAALMRA